MTTLTVTNHVIAMATQMYTLQQEGILCDVSLMGENSIVEVHSVVLASISSKLKPRLSRRARDHKDSLVLLTEYSQDVLNRFVHFMYTGSVRITTEVARDLLAAFKDFKLMDAAAMCEKFINEEVGTSSQGAAQASSRVEDWDQRSEDLSEVTSTNDLVTGDADGDGESVEMLPSTYSRSRNQRQIAPCDENPTGFSVSNQSMTLTKNKSKSTPKKRKHGLTKSESSKKRRSAPEKVLNESPSRTADQTRTRNQKLQLLNDHEAMSDERCHSDENLRMLQADYNKTFNKTNSRCTSLLNTHAAKNNTGVTATDNSNYRSNNTMTGLPTLAAPVFDKESHLDNALNSHVEKDKAVALVTKNCYAVGSSKTVESVPDLSSLPIRAGSNASLWGIEEITPVDGGLSSHQVVVSADQLDLCDSYSMDYKPVLYDMDGERDHMEMDGEGLDETMGAGLADETSSRTIREEESTGSITAGSKFRCEDCFREYKWKKDLTAHKKKCKKDPLPKLQCRRCRNMFKSADEKTDHEKKCEVSPPKKTPGPKRIKCDLCNYHCRTQKMKLSHMHNKHNMPFDHNNGDYVVHKCDAEGCSFETLYQFWLEAHRRSHTTDSCFMCEVCGQGFKTSVGLRNHSRATHDGDMLACNQCEKKFVSQTTLRAHCLRVHRNQRRFQCSHCPYQSFNLPTLEAHMHSKHQVPYPENRVVYSCTHCDYVTCRKNQYKSHMHRHKGETPFVCKVCGKGFPGQSELTSHQKWHMAVADRKHKCPYEGCTYAGILPNRLQDHIRQIHTHKHIKPYKCEMCVYQTNVRGNLLLHLRRAHKMNVEGKQTRIRRIDESQPPVSSSQIIAQAMREEGIPLSAEEILDSSGHVDGSTMEEGSANMAVVSKENGPLQECDTMGMRGYLSEQPVDHMQGQGHLVSQGHIQMQSQNQFHKNYLPVPPELATRKDTPNVTVDMSSGPPDQRRHMRHETDKDNAAPTTLNDLSKSVGPISVMLPQGHIMPRQVRPPGPPHHPHMAVSSVPGLYRQSLPQASSHQPAPPPIHHHGQHALHAMFPEISQAVKPYSAPSTANPTPTSSGYLSSSAPPNLQLPSSYHSPMGPYVSAQGHLQPPSVGPALYHPYWTQVMGPMSSSSEPGQGHVNVIHDIEQL